MFTHEKKIFIDDLAEVETFPRDKVLHHLESISDDLAIQYLEYIIHELRDTLPDFHNRLAIAYLDKIISCEASKDSIIIIIIIQAYYYYYYLFFSDVYIYIYIYIYLYMFMAHFLY